MRSHDPVSQGSVWLKMFGNYCTTSLAFNQDLPDPNLYPLNSTVSLSSPLLSSIDMQCDPLGLLSFK